MASPFLRKTKAVLVDGPPVVVDALVKLGCWARWKLTESSMDEIKIPKTKVDVISENGRFKLKLTRPKSDPDPALARAAGNLISFLESDIELASSKRSFAAAWRGVPLCEAPRY